MTRLIPHEARSVSDSVRRVRVCVSVLRIAIGHIVAAHVIRFFLEELITFLRSCRHLLAQRSRASGSRRHKHSVALRPARLHLHVQARVRLERAEGVRLER